jgi:hypothetical protein
MTAMSQVRRLGPESAKQRIVLTDAAEAFCATWAISGMSARNMLVYALDDGQDQIFHRAK